MNKLPFVKRLLSVVLLLGAIAVLAYVGMGRSDAEDQQTPPAPAPAAKATATAVGSDTCLACHDQVKGQLAGQFHATALADAEAKGKGRLCEGCHGPGSIHANDPGPETGKVLRAYANSGEGCLRCHGSKLSSTQWRMSEHHRNGVSCLACHGKTTAMPVHGKQTKEEKAAAAKAKPFSHADFTTKPTSETCFTCHGNKRGEFSLPSHHPVKEKRITCSDCHNPHTPMGQAVKRDVCRTCHADQHGPYRFEHAAISAEALTDGCVSCHRPHGASNQRLLKLHGRGLCLQCHADKVQHHPGITCWNCHTAVHGSNSSGLLFEE